MSITTCSVRCFSSYTLPRVKQLLKSSGRITLLKNCLARKDTLRQNAMYRVTVNVQHIWCPHHEVTDVNWAHSRPSLDLVVIDVTVLKLECLVNITRTLILSGDLFGVSIKMGT